MGLKPEHPTGSFKKWEKVETYNQLIEKLTEMFEKEGFSPYALDVYAERMPRVQMMAAGPVVVNDRKVLLATYKYGQVGIRSVDGLFAKTPTLRVTLSR